MADNTLVPNQLTIDAYQSIKQKIEDQKEKTDHIRTTFYVETPQDKKKHEYFTSFNIDADISDFMHTAELKAPYDSDLMAYWEPIRQTCVIYGSNRGEPQMLFIGRVREVKQQGYEIVITLQNYGWKFKQDVSPGAAEKYVVGKNGYEIIKWMFDFLKIDAYYISPSTKSRLKAVKYDEEGKITIKGEEVEEIPDIIERVKKLDPTKFNDKNVLAGKLREDKIRNIENINYTAPYLEGTGMAEAIAAKNSGSGGYGTGGYGTGDYGVGGYGVGGAEALGSSIGSLGASVANKLSPSKGSKMQSLGSSVASLPASYNSRSISKAITSSASKKPSSSQTSTKIKTTKKYKQQLKAGKRQALAKENKANNAAVRKGIINAAKTIWNMFAGNPYD